MKRMPAPSLMTKLQRGAVAVAFVRLCAPAGAGAQPALASDPFAAVSFLVGRWEGSAEGQPGTGTLRREYERVLGGRFIRVHNRSEYPAQVKNPKAKSTKTRGISASTVHGGASSFGNSHVEGFVNPYVHDEGATPDRMVFTTEAIENIPAGWRARETYVRHGPDSFEEIFELAEAGKPFEVYSRARLRRIK